MLARLLRICDAGIDAAAILGASDLVVTLGVITADVIGRAFGHPLYGARDIVSMAGVFVVFSGLAYAHRAGSHIVVDLLEPMFPPRLNVILTVAGHWLGAVIMVLMVWQMAVAVDLARMLKTSTNLLFLPRAPFLMVMMAMASVCAASMLLRGAKAWQDHAASVRRAA